jgi:hypothetical protein
MIEVLGRPVTPELGGHSHELCADHGSRSVTMGSTLVARRAGR